MKPLKESSGGFRELVESGPIDNNSEDSKGDLLEKRRFLTGSVAAVVQQMMVKIDLHRAGFGAGSAEGTGVGQMFPFLKAPEMRSDNRANRP